MAAVFAAAAVLLVVAGCAGQKAPTWAERNAQFEVLGSAVETSNARVSPMPGLAASSVPREGLKGMPGADEIVVANGTPSFTRERAIEQSRPNGGALVSAVDVLLPAKFLNAALPGKKRQSQPRTAWIVTWSGVTFYAHGMGTKERQILDSNLVVVIDATTGDELLRTQYGGRQ